MGRSHQRQLISQLAGPLPPTSALLRRAQGPSSRKREDSQKREDSHTHAGTAIRVSPSRRDYLRPPRSEGRVGRSHQRHLRSQPVGISPSYLRPPSSAQGPSSRKREDSRFGELVLQSSDLLYSSYVAVFSGEFRLEEGCDQFPGYFRSDDPGTEAQHVDVVVFDHLMGGVGVVRN